MGCPYHTKKRPAPVIPVVFHHGKAKWKQRDFKDYFNDVDENLEPFLPAFEYVLNDLSRLSDEEIARKYNEIKLRTALLLMKNISDEARLQNKLPFIFYGFREVTDSETGEKFFVAAINYLFSFVEKPDVNELTQKIKKPKERRNSHDYCGKIEKKKDSEKEGRKDYVKENLKGNI